MELLFLLYLLVACELGYQDILGLKNTYCLREKINTFWSKGINTLWSGGIGTVWHRKSQTKNQQFS